MGEVIAAASDLQARGLSERGFYALIAIAEKSHAATRQASVPWSHIRAGLFGKSLPTAKRAVGDLKAAGVLKVIRRGFDNHAGRVCAPIYEIRPLTERITQVSQSPTNRTDHSGDPIGKGERIESGGRTDHPGDLLNGSTNGSSGYLSGDSYEADAVAATPGAELVGRIIPREHPDAVKTALRIRASELLKSGTKRDTVEAALELWLTKPHLGPHALPSLVSEVIKARAVAPLNSQQTASTVDRKVTGWLQMNVRTPQTRTELE